MKCDGVPEEEHANDESLDECLKQKVFAPGATKKCKMAGLTHTNLTIFIMAIPCNGIIECEGGVDELNCQTNDNILFVSLGSGVLIALMVSGVVAWIIKTRLDILSSHSPLSDTSQYEIKQVLDIQKKPIEERKRQNCTEFGLDLRKINGNQAKATNLIKVTFLTAFLQLGMSYCLFQWFQ